MEDFESLYLGKYTFVYDWIEKLVNEEWKFPKNPVRV